MPNLADFDPKLVKLSAFARALSHPVRIQILQLAGRRKETAAMDLVGQLPLSQPACSRHLRELVAVGLIKARSSGSHIYYRLDAKALEGFCKAMSATLHP